MKCKCGHDKEEHYAWSCSQKRRILVGCSNDENGTCGCWKFEEDLK